MPGSTSLYDTLSSLHI